MVEKSKKPIRTIEAGRIVTQLNQMAQRDPLLAAHLETAIALAAQDIQAEGLKAQGKHIEVLEAKLEEAGVEVEE